MVRGGGSQSGIDQDAVAISTLITLAKKKNRTKTHLCDTLVSALFPTLPKVSYKIIDFARADLSPHHTIQEREVHRNTRVKHIVRPL